MADWRQDPRILAIKEQYEREGESPEVLDALRREVPAARRRAEVSEEYGSLHSAAIAAGSEFARIGEGARMIVADLLDDKDMRDRAEADRAARERLMRPLEEARPIATTVGAMAPSMALPGGMAGGLVRRMATAALSGGAYEGIASGGEAAPTALATVASPFTSEAGRLAGRWLFGPGVRGVEGPDLSGSPSHREMLTEGQALGMQYTPAQRTGSPVLEQFEASMSRSPYMSGPFHEFTAENAKLANRMAREAIGLKGDDLITDDVLNARHAELGEQFEKIVGGDKSFEISPDFMDTVDALRDVYMRGLTRTERVRNNLKNLNEIAQDQYIRVDQYQQLASDLASSARHAHREGDAPGERALYAAREALDREFDRTYGDIDKLQKVRRYWRRLRQIEESKAILRGQFRPITFAKYLRGPREGKGVVKDKAPLARLGVVDEYIANAIANSGTPTGQAVPDFMNASILGKIGMLGGGGVSRAYLANPRIMTGPGGLGYMPQRMTTPIQSMPIPLTPWRVPLGLGSPVQGLTTALQRGGRAQGVQFGQGGGALGGLL